VQELSSLDFHPDRKSAAVQQQFRPATESGPISVGSFDVTHGAKGNGCFPAACQLSLCATVNFAPTLPVLANYSGICFCQLEAAT